MGYPPTVTVALVVAFAACASPQGATQRPTSPATQSPPRGAAVNEYGAATKAFLDRVQQYMVFHTNVQKMVPPLTEGSHPEVAKRGMVLGAMLVKQRPDAKEGDFFIEEYRPYLIKIIQDDFDKRPMADRKALMADFPKDVKIGVNIVYPPALPLATFPANLLKALPELPKALEYRIVGQHLILRDVTGNIIIDVLRDVIPIPK